MVRFFTHVSRSFFQTKGTWELYCRFLLRRSELVIELDGSGHYTDEAKEYDEKRTAFLEKYGLKVIRIPNTEINNNFRGVCEYINHIVEQSLSQLR